jgi:acyl-CoA dehydrogenase
MRSIGAAQMALDTMIQRVTDPTRKTFGKFLFEHGKLAPFANALILVGRSSLFISTGTVVADIAKSRAEIESARLLVLSAALQASWFLPANVKFLLRVA